ncbi:MAG: M56 family metallopeptidase [Gemmatimonadota bacterium]
MIAAWMLYLIVVSGLLSIAALSAERALRWLNRPIRVAWSLAILGTPALATLAAGTGGPGVFGLYGSAGASALTGAARGSKSGGWASYLSDVALGPVTAAWNALRTSAGNLDRPLLFLWIGASVAVLLVMSISMRRLHVASRGWPRRRVEGSDVRVSRDLGPAVLGIGRAEVVLPAWVLDQDPTRRRLIVLHESEHLRARDGTLLFAGLLVAAAIPWNPLGWWQLRRLRLAVELDCDRRVLRTGVGLREYASLLLEAGRRRAVPFGSTAAFVHFDSQLGRRIRMMTENRNTPRYGPAAVALTMAAAILIVACTAPAPMETDGQASAVPVESRPAGEAVAQNVLRKLDESGQWTAGLERAAGNERVELEFGEQQRFLFESKDGTLHLSEEGKLAEVSKVELARLYGQQATGTYELRHLSEDELGTSTMKRKIEEKESAGARFGPK